MLAWTRDDRETLRELAASPSLEPAESAYLLALARLGGPEDAAARAELVRLFQQDPWRLRAALALLGRVLASPGAAGQPQQARLEVARALLGPEGDWPALRRLLTDSTPANVADAVALARILRSAGDNEAAADWLARRATAWPSDVTLASERADLAVALGRWSELPPLLVQGAWGPLPSAAVELALAARLQNARGKSRNALLTWGDALAEAEPVPGAARALARARHHRRGPGRRDQTRPDPRTLAPLRRRESRGDRRGRLCPPPRRRRMD